MRTRAPQMALIRTMESPALFRAAVRSGQLARRLGALLPDLGAADDGAAAGVAGARAASCGR